MAPVHSRFLLVSLVAGFGGFLFGYDTAVINGANQYLRAYFQLTPFQEGLAGASAILGCIPGAMGAGFLGDRIGRRRVLFLSAILYGVSALWSAVPSTFEEFLIARFIGGLGIGASSMVCPVYIAELAPAARRGRLGSLFQLGIVLGIFLTLFVNALIQGAGDEVWNTQSGWRWMLGAEILPSLVFLGLLVFAPESPRWLLAAGREVEARALLEKLVGPAHAEKEVRAVRASLAQETGRFSDLLSGRLRTPLLIAVVLMAVSQFSGINAIMYYSTKIFSSAGVGVRDAFGASVIVGLVNLVFTLVAIALVDRAGRRPLLLAGLALQVVALSCVGILFHAGVSGPGLLAGVLVFIAAFAVALGPIPWIVCSEIFPTKLRGRAMSVATFVIWTSCYVVAQTFPMLNDHPAIGPGNTFFVYAAASLGGLIFVALMLPETKGRTLEQLETLWPTRPPRTGSSSS